MLGNAGDLGEAVTRIIFGVPPTPAATPTVTRPPRAVTVGAATGFCGTPGTSGQFKVV